eukprot:TRINITY_DN4406_c0_g1_i1.p1 TRINITY_DN4406_c0_g1~~TRINITY_DN4406_c0_g1_i1.p1  ORF type:complete len:242 (-),score=17.52 TRINITY_DN4406_c0_g1_i1:16-741(-)
MSHAKQQQQHECMHYYARQWIRAHTREQPTADIATRAAAFMQAFPYDLRPFAAACCPCTASAVEAASAGECALSSGEAACGLSLLLCNEWGRIIQRHLPGTADEQPAGEVSPEPPVKKRMVCADGTRQEQQFRVTAVHIYLTLQLCSACIHAVLLWLSEASAARGQLRKARRAATSGGDSHASLLAAYSATGSGKGRGRASAAGQLSAGCRVTCVTFRGRHDSLTSELVGLLCKRNLSTES